MALSLLAGLIVIQALAQDTVQQPAALDDRFPLELTGDLMEDQDGSALMDALDWIRLHPYDLNCISLAELISIPCVTLSGACAILNYRKEGGTFGAAGDLLTIAGGSESLYRALAPYVCVRRKSASPGRRVSLRTRAVQQTPAVGATPGSPLRLSSRLVLEDYRGLEAGTLFAKGAGERTEDAFVSAYARMTNIGCVSEILAGDYELESGQGLVFWRGPSAAGSLWSVRPGEGLAVVPHRSSDETRFLRGLAVTFSANERWSGTLFCSDRTYGANVDTTGEATAFFRGEYATVSSIAKKDMLRERLAGVHAGCIFPGAFSAGCTAYRSFFDRWFSPADRTRFSGDRVDAVSLDIGGRFGNISFAGEYALMKGGAHALLWTVTLASGGDGTLMIRCRDYQPGYDNPHSSGEGDNGETRNERGVAAGLRLHPFPGIIIACHVDAFDHPWPTALSPIPRRGTGITLTGESRLPHSGRFSVRYSRKCSYEAAAATDAWGRDVKSAWVRGEDHCRCEISRRCGEISGVTTILEYAGVRRSPGDVVHGVLLGGDVSLSPLSCLSVDVRFSLFHTDGYDARLYDFEQGLPGTASIPPLYGHGVRWYIRMRWSPGEWGEIAARYARTVREPSVSAAEPFREIPGDAAGQISVQADIRFP